MKGRTKYREMLVVTGDALAPLACHDVKASC